MTRREFFQSVFKTAAAIAAGIYVFTDKARLAEDAESRQVSIKAFRQKGYPGKVKQMPNIFTQGKWRG